MPETKTELGHPRTNLENNLVAQEHWNQGYENLPLSVAPDTDPIARLLERFAGEGNGRQAFEIGCYPGRYLARLGRADFVLNGIDAATCMPQLADWLTDCGYCVGKLKQGDFFALEADPIYDIVASFGFIEHFVDWEDCVERHCDFVKPGGTLIITVPNFAGSLQRAIHTHFDKENLELHNCKAMDVAAISRVIAGKGFTIKYGDYFPEFDFWVAKRKRPPHQKAVVKLLKTARPLLRLLPPARSWSPYAGVVATKDQ